jgi:hypothetical protein
MPVSYQDVYQLDQAGRKRLAGLTFEETNEFLQLEKLLDHSLSSKSVVRWTDVEEARFVDLLLRYELALQAERNASGEP